MGTYFLWKLLRQVSCFVGRPAVRALYIVTYLFNKHLFQTAHQASEKRDTSSMCHLHVPLIYNIVLFISTLFLFASLFSDTFACRCFCLLFLLYFCFLIYFPLGFFCDISMPCSYVVASTRPQDCIAPTVTTAGTVVICIIRDGCYIVMKYALYKNILM